MSGRIYTSRERIEKQVGLDKVPGNVVLDRIMRFASLCVTMATRGATYETDDEGMPTELPVKEAMAEAATIQAVAVIEGDLTGVITTGGASAKPSVKSASDNGASLTFDNSVGERAQVDFVTGRLVPLAYAVLEEAGLVGNKPNIVM